jgi:hypothetical protein
VVLGAAGLRVGRAPDNDLVLADPEISWGHAEFWASEGRVYVRDRGSSNGTFVNGWRVRVPLAVAEADEVRLGSRLLLRVEGAEGVTTQAGPGWLAEDLEKGVLIPVTDAVPGIDPPDESGTIEFPPGTRVAAGSPFRVEGRAFRLVAASGVPVPTASPSGGGWPYRLAVTLDGATGPEATLEHRTQPRKCKITAENRAVLLYVLARQAIDDRRQSRPADQVGWCDDQDVVSGIWGREGATMDVNGLHVLIHRVRRDIEAAGFDPSFLEKRRRGIRISLVDVGIE